MLVSGGRRVLAIRRRRQNHCLLGENRQIWIREDDISTKVINHRSSLSAESLHLDTLLGPNPLLLWKMHYFTKGSTGGADWDENSPHHMKI